MKDLLKYSSAFGPPKLNLRDAQIISSYGRKDSAKLEINHNSPADVKDHEIDYYSYSVFSFMNLKDLIFYTYAIFQKHKAEGDYTHMDFLLYGYERNMDELKELLTSDLKSIFISSCNELFNLHGFEAAWEQCPNLSKFIGIDITEKAIDEWYEQKDLTNGST